MKSEHTVDPDYIAGGNRQNPISAILVQKLKLTYVLTKTLKGFDTKMKNKKFIFVEKIASFQ